MHDIAKPVKTQMKSKLRTIGVAVGSLIALIVIIVGIKGLEIGKMMSTPMVMPPTTVSSATVKEEDWAPTLSAVGSIAAVQGEVVSSQLGIRQVNVGQMINSGQQVVQLSSLDSLFADFALPQQYLGQLTPGLQVHVTTDALPGHVFPGKVTAINSMVDSSTRNITLQATLENPDHVLRPGMFAKAEVTLPEKHKALVVPGSAISYAPFGDSVFVIEKKKDEKTGKESQAIRQQFVRVGEARGDLVAITQGLKAGETIVSTGVFKLRNGMAVTINNDLAPNPQVNPNPVDS